MKTSIKQIIRILLVGIMFISLTSCGVVNVGANDYNELVGLVQGVQSAASNFQLVVDTQYAKVQAKTQITKDYYDAVNKSGEVWTGNFRSQADALTNLLNNYRDANGQPLDPTKLNLSELQSKGALPNNLGQGFSLYVNAVTQAAPPVPDAQVTLALGDTIDESMNTIQLAGSDWNDAVKAYNTRRAQISGEIVARVSAYFGFDLPVTFPYYQGANAGQPVRESAGNAIDIFTNTAFHRAQIPNGQHQ